MPFPTDQDFPTLGESHLSDARLFADRSGMLLALCPAFAGTICEVGVGLGGFSRFLIDHLRPPRFVAIDDFRLHELPELWGSPTSSVFGHRTHRQHYEAQFAYAQDRITLIEAPSHEGLATLPDASVDIMYIDADHTYAGVRRDLEAALPKIAPGGLFVFNDYLMVDTGGAPYGVVPAVNELVAGSDWKIVGFSLQKYMFCDIALRRMSDA